MVSNANILILFLLPLCSAGLIALLLGKSGRIAAGVSIASAAACLIVALRMLSHWDMETVHRTVTWYSMGDLKVTLGFLLNPTAAVLLFVVTFVGFFIHLFAVEYSEHDDARGRFFGGMSIFMFSMTGIVLSSNLIMMFVFWELVGFSSYLLIGHYRERESAANAANKAFIVNRIGDFGFLIGIIAIWAKFGTTDLLALEAMVSADPSKLQTMIGLLLFCGVLGKSAQMPLHVWLPDAMEGPTPVSALIHAATMVAAGVFLMCRVFFLFSADALELIMWVGVVTAIYSGICAITQKDIKKILAYSTLSQLGYMVAAFAIGTAAAHAGHEYGVGASLFHLTTHAFFKALLFLAAGSIIHATHHEQNIFRMGGLISRMPWTSVCFSLGLLALVGCPGFSGFWSKEGILSLAWEHERPVFYALLAGVGITALYMARLWVTVFLGNPKTEAVGHAKENSWVMVLPLVVLAIYSVFAGWFTPLFPNSTLPILVDSIPHAPESMKVWLPILSFGTMVVGLVLGGLIYKSGGEKDNLETGLPFLYRFIQSKLWFDEIYLFYVQRIQQPIARLLSHIDLLVISGVGMRGIAGGGAGLMGQVLRLLTTGNVHHYVYWFAVGILACVAVVAGLS